MRYKAESIINTDRVSVSPLFFGCVLKVNICFCSLDFADLFSGFFFIQCYRIKFYEMYNLKNPMTKNTNSDCYNYVTCIIHSCSCKLF